MIQEKECGAQQVHRTILSDGTKVYVTLETTCTYAGPVSNETKVYTRTSPTFKYDQETVLNDTISIEELNSVVAKLIGG